MKTVQEFRKKAFEVFGSEKHNVTTSDPIEFLYSLEWDMCEALPLDELAIAIFNMEFDLRSCFGRAVRAAVLAEKYFPDYADQFYFGEVCDDALRNLLLQKAKESSSLWKDESFIEEILQYENPHSVLLYQERQFDPLFIELSKAYSNKPGNFAHQEVNQLSMWEALLASYLMSAATVELQMKGDLQASVVLTDHAQTVCPDMILIQENRILHLELLGKSDEAKELALSLYGKRKNVRLLWVLWKFTGDDLYKEAIVSEYSTEMLNYLNQKFDTNT